MVYSYNKLWKLLIDKNMMKKRPNGENKNNLFHNSKNGKRRSSQLRYTWQDM